MRNLLLCLITLGLIHLNSDLAVAQTSKTDEAPVEATSLLGQPLRRMTFSAERKKQLDQDLAVAQKNYDKDPNNIDNIIWLGRRTAYLWRYNDAVKIFSEGIRLHPNEPRLYRHRGHRYITLRKFDLAIVDLKKASQLIVGQPDVVEPDGQPNAAGIPTSSLHTNVWYHLGLAYYLNFDFPSALAAYEKCLSAARNNDMRVATLDWMYMTLRRMKRNEDATQVIKDVTAKLKIIENHAYHHRILMYRGFKKPEDLIPSKDSTNRDLDIATYGYGVANWYLVNGQKEKSTKLLREVVRGKYWAAFGYIAAETELARINAAKPLQTDK